MNEQDAKVTIEGIKFQAKQLDEKPCPWSDDWRPHWVLIFRFANHSSRFDFWNNIANKAPQKMDLLSMLLGDATVGLMDIDEFASEYGYTKVSVVIRTHKACQKTARKFMRLLSCTSDDLYDLANMVNDWKTA